jgi:4-hydroxy-tetrahydrodipicolinate synthase
MSAKYFLQKRGLPVRTISRTHALELTPLQKQTLDEIHRSFLQWCDKLGIKPVNVEELLQPITHLDPAI